MTREIDPVALTQDLVRLPSMNPPGNEEDCTLYLAGLLRQHGFSVQLQCFAQHRYNLVAELPGQPGMKILGFSGHMDTVPLGAEPWGQEPFAAHIIDGRLYGRGVTDMKSGIAAFIVACLRAREELGAALGIQLFLTGGEETGCEGARALVSQSEFKLTPVDALIIGEPTRNRPCIGHKGALWLRGMASGTSAHGAMPEQGSNAIYKVTEAIGRLQDHQWPGSHPLMGHTSFNVGRIQGGSNVNSVPDRAEFELDVRTVPGMLHQHLQDDLQALLEGVQLHAFVDLPPICSDPADTWIKAVFAVCDAHHDEADQAKTVPYFTDASILAPALGMPPTIILGPGEPSVMHATNEYCEVDAIRDATDIYLKIIRIFSSEASQARVGQAVSGLVQKIQVT